MNTSLWDIILVVVGVLAVLWILSTISWFIVKFLVLIAAIYGVIYVVKRYLL
jgi:hypothetical protein